MYTSPLCYLVCVNGVHPCDGPVHCVTSCALMECSPLTGQSTSGTGDPEPLQVMVTVPPSTNVRLLWVTLISGKSGTHTQTTGGQRT